MNYNNNKCNSRGTCKICKKVFRGGEVCQLINWKENGTFCKNCLNDSEKKCYWCNKVFVDFEFTDKEKQDLEKYKIREVEHPNYNVMCSFSHGSGGCFRKECIGHHPQQLGVFCSKDCHDERLGGANLEGSKYKEWKEHAEKLGWTPCQEKDLFRDWDDHPKLSTYKEKIRKEKGEQALACDKMAAPGEKYCFYCECERKNEEWGDHRNNEKNWVKNYRDYWNLTNDKNDWPDNRENISESSTLVSSSNDNKIEKLEKELIEAKRQRKSTQEIERLQSELQKLSNNQQRKEEIKPAKNNNLLISGVIIFLVSTLILGVIMINRTAKSKKNN